jgi:hypothetical protein
MGAQCAEDRQRESRGFASSSLRGSDDITPFEYLRDGTRLNGRRFFVTELCNGIEHRRLQPQFRK